VVNKQNDTLWSIFVAGPEQTPFEGGQFEIEFKLDNFPFKGPVVSFKTQIYHPNVDKQGQICADMLETGDKWAPTKKLVKVMEKIKSLLVVPNLETPMNEEAAKDYKNNTWAAKAKQLNIQIAKGG
jgi:ubiquitin-protein ligase